MRTRRGRPGRQGGAARGWPSAAARLLGPRACRAAGSCALGLVLLSGCAGNREAAAPSSDPLLGPPPPPKPAGQVAAPGPAGAGEPLPSPTAPVQATSTAALASNPAHAPENPQDLRIPNTAPKPDATAGQWGGTVLRQPEPVPEAAARGDGMLARASGMTAGSRVTTYEQAQALLAARGVVWQRLESSGDLGEWKFTCSLPNRQNRAFVHTYEGRARDYLSAIRIVLDQIDQEP